MEVYEGIDICDIPSQIVDSFSWRIQSVYCELLATDACGDLNTAHGREILGFVEDAYCNTHRLHERAACYSSRIDRSGLEAVTVCDGTIGRPAFVVPCDVLQYLLEVHLSVPAISDLLGVSVSTIRCRMNNYGLSVRDTYANIGDEELDYYIESVHNGHPTWGVRQTYGHLISIGIRVQYHRVRESLCRIDPEGSYMRRLRHLRRRKYAVAGPQSLWHIDGCHQSVMMIMKRWWN